MKTTLALALAIIALASCARGPSMMEKKPDGTIRIVTTYNGIFDKSESDDHVATLADGTRLEFHGRKRDNTKAASVWGNLMTTKQLSPITEELGTAIKK